MQKAQQNLHVFELLWASVKQSTQRLITNSD